jgi:hypothetical protein
MSLPRKTIFWTAAGHLPLFVFTGLFQTQQTKKMLPAITFRINTSKSVSKQMTLSVFGMNA